MSCKLVGRARPHNLQSFARRCSRSTVAHHVRSSSSTAATERKWSTPLAKELAEAITTTGPIPIAAYMRQCLTSESRGYYTTAKSDASPSTPGDQFGLAGDFVTSPEISQIFGELVGIWFVAEWLAQGKPSNIQLIELGPGRGTLMSDALRAISNFASMATSIETIWLVEASPTLRLAQKNLLCGADAALEDTDRGWRSSLAATRGALAGKEVQWVEDLTFLPKDTSKTPFVVAHEFFDALPIHAFQSITEPAPTSSTITTSTTPQASAPPQRKAWRELLVNPTRPPSLLNPPKDAPPDFELTLAPTPTAHSSFLPQLSPRYTRLLRDTPVGSSIEVSPESQTSVAVLAALIGGPAKNQVPSVVRMRRPRPDATPSEPAVLKQKPRPAGAALLVDYGPAETVPVNSLRGIRAHARVSPFVGAGDVDLSADVDFGALAEAAIRASPGVEVHGPVEQAAWLNGMGGAARVEQLVRGKDGEEARRVRDAWARLVDKGPSGMGKVYKCLAIVPWHEALKQAERRPVGFGGDVAV